MGYFSRWGGSGAKIAEKETGGRVLSLSEQSVDKGLDHNYRDIVDNNIFQIPDEVGGLRGSNGVNLERDKNVSLKGPINQPLSSVVIRGIVDSNVFKGKDMVIDTNLSEGLASLGPTNYGPC
ncbi:hypothetical protein ACH5RR_001712 [Cinchona calisaya]|uniref:Uncharacterized protein n=1 Tax=Cinchona calisaya TaxID=153742 RepID=A0ABD3B4M0_9GENT